MSDMVRNTEDFGRDWPTDDLVHAAGDELRAMDASVLAEHLSYAVLSDFPADDIHRINYYLQCALGFESMVKMAADLAADIAITD